MADKVATFSINLAGNAAEASKAATDELEAFRSKIEASQVALKGMVGSLRALKGSSEEVAAAKEGLKAKIEAEKGALSQSTLELVKQGHSYEQLTSEMRKNEAAARKLELKRQAKEMKDLAEGAGKVKAGFSAAGGPLSDLMGKLETLKGVSGGAGGGMGVLAMGVGIVVVAVAALTTAVIAAGVKLGEFVITGADALRSMNLMREAASGSAENAKNLGSQVEFLGRRVATSTEKINEIGVSLVKSLSGGTSKASGQAIVDTFAAVTEASAAMGDEVGSTLKGIIERGKTFGRIRLNPFELQGTGLKFGDVAEALAKNLGVGIAKARTALFEGRVKLADGAAALRTAVETKFGGVNAEKLLSIDVQFAKLHERLIGLTKGVVLEPLLKGLATLLAKFDATTVTGQSIANIFTKIGNAIVKFSVAHVDDVVKGVERLVLWGLEAVELFDKWAPKVKGVTDALFGNKVMMETLKVVGFGIVAVVGAVGLAIGAVVGALAGTAVMIGAPIYALYKGYQFIAGLDWADLGKGIIEGLVNGLKAGAKWLYDAVTGLATKVKDAFMSAMKLGSPSKVFEGYGKDTAAGYAQGVDTGAPQAQRAVDSMAPRAPGRGAGVALGGGGGAPSVVIHFELNVHGVKGEPQALAAAVSSPSVLRALSRAVREAMVTQGVPTQAPVPT